MAKEKEDKVFYNLEFSKDAITFVADACNIASSIKVGRLDVLMEHFQRSYLERNGRTMPNEITDQVKNLLSVLQRTIWDSTYGNTSVIHRVHPEADIMLDIKEVIDYQMALEEHSDNMPQYPIGWNDEVDAPRFIKRFVTRCNRTKQLRSFVDVPKE